MLDFGADGPSELASPPEEKHVLLWRFIATRQKMIAAPRCALFGISSPLLGNETSSIYIARGVTAGGGMAGGSEKESMLDVITKQMKEENRVSIQLARKRLGL